ncbi:hypothetical protein DV515_00003690 [Chloebia gouldiae]|uniref:Uncharacterized protein n=1 Tax=Chloebia gouldiae TaxID=44316 RepID=A0A3L8ST87_CHLGU|nr:hypothetical protein DV515_00003690 [Chloebia gouldiae]
MAEGNSLLQEWKEKTRGPPKPERTGEIDMEYSNKSTGLEALQGDYVTMLQAGIQLPAPKQTDVEDTESLSTLRDKNDETTACLHVPPRLQI